MKMLLRNYCAKEAETRRVPTETGRVPIETGRVATETGLVPIETGRVPIGVTPKDLLVLQALLCT